MAKFKDTIITIQGMAAVTAAVGGGYRNKYLNAYTSTQDLTGMTDDDLRGLTTLSGQQQTVAVSETEINDADNQVKLGVVFINKGVPEDYNIMSIGWTCENANGQEILFAITPMVTAEIMPADDGTGSGFFTIYPELMMAVSQSGDVTVNVSTGGLITRAQLDEALQPKANDAEVTHPADIAMETLNGVSFEIDTSGLSINDYPRFVAHVYYNGAGIAQTVSYAGVPLMSELLMSADLKVNGQTMIPKFWTMQLKAAAPDFDTKNFTTNRSSDGTWMYIISKKPDTDQATIGIQCLNATFKEVV